MFVTESSSNDTDCESFWEDERSRLSFLVRHQLFIEDSMFLLIRVIFVFNSNVLTWCRRLCVVTWFRDTWRIDIMINVDSKVDNTSLITVRPTLSDVLPKHIHWHLAVLSFNRHFEQYCATFIRSILIPFWILFSSWAQNEYIQRHSPISLVKCRKSKGLWTVVYITPIPIWTAFAKKE